MSSSSFKVQAPPVRVASVRLSLPVSLLSAVQERGERRVFFQTPSFSEAIGAKRQVWRAGMRTSSITAFTALPAAHAREGVMQVGHSRVAYGAKAPCSAMSGASSAARSSAGADCAQSECDKRSGRYGSPGSSGEVAWCGSLVSRCSAECRRRRVYVRRQQCFAAAAGAFLRAESRRSRVVRVMLSCCMATVYACRVYLLCFLSSLFSSPS